MKTYYQPPQQEIWQGRADTQPNERFFQLFHCVDLEKNNVDKKTLQNFALVGFACDEGVKRNFGRVGAKDGPMALRKALGNLAAHHIDDKYFYDVGNVICENGNLEEAQQVLAEIVAMLISKGITPLVIGGGHEVAWGHYQGIVRAFPKNSLGIINIDAHLDLRPLIDGKLGSSGTSFFQIAEDRKKNHLSFDYACIGVQSMANTKSLLQKAAELHTEIIYAEQVLRRDDALYTLLKLFTHEHDNIYLTLCMDVFSSAVAPGVSAPQICGLPPYHVVQIIKSLASSKKILSFDIAELSPPNDVNDMTAKLAAAMLAVFLANVLPR